MKKVLGHALLASMLLAVPQVGFAQAKQGDKEVLLQGNIGSFFSSFEDSVSATTTGTATVGIGYFATERLQFGVAPTLQMSTGSGVDGGTTLQTSLGFSTRLQYFFGASASKVKPYIGYELLVSDVEAPENGSIADNMFNSGLFGVKNYLSERAALDFNGSYGLGMNSTSAQQLTFRIGMSYLF